MVLLVSKSSSLTPSSSSSSSSSFSSSKSYESDYVPLSERFNEIAPSSKKAISPWRKEKARAFLHFESNFMDMDDDKLMALLYSSSAPTKRRRSHLMDELVKRIDVFVGFFRGHLLQTMTRRLC